MIRFECVEVGRAMGIRAASLSLSIGLLLMAPAARAQVATSNYSIQADRQEQIAENHQKLIGRVEIENGGTKLYADEAELFQDEDRVVLTGNVAFSQGANTIAADRAEFNTRTKLGTFHNAYGIAPVQQQARGLTQGSISVPLLTGEPNEVYFFGETIEKLGPKKYKITNGGFSTCVQPTPRWDLHADTIILNIDHHTLLKQAIFNVKGVPVMYLPILYYPTREDGRATGFLLPTYGASSLRGQSIHNAFFWAISRSQDATFMHDWYSRTGQAFGSEYRYDVGTGFGAVRGHLLQDHETTYPNGSVLPESQSFEVSGNALQLLPGRFRARGNVDYFSNVTTMQTYNTNIYDYSRNRRTYGANMVGAWKDYSLSTTFEHTENFYTTNSSVVWGSAPRVSLTRGDRPVTKNSPLHFSAGAEYVTLIRETRAGNAAVDSGLSRFDFFPQVRYPLTKWQWFTVDSTVSFRDTFYTRSFDPASTTVVDDGLNRQYVAVQTQIFGPVFNKVWDTPNSRYSEKFKHTIEPTITLSHTSPIENLDRIVKTDSVDQIVGTTTYVYGLNNRFYAKRKVGQSSHAQEVITVSLSQSYYTNTEASRFDYNYQTSLSTKPSNFSPISLDVRAAPTTSVSGGVHAEVDSTYHQVRLVTVNGAYNLTGRLQTNVGWTQKFFIAGLPGFNVRGSLDHYLYAQTNAQTRDNRYGIRYQLYYDVLRGTMVQQTLAGFYNTQCCGVALQFSPRNYGGTIGKNRSFFMSVTLAGLGNFSPLNGALGGMSN